VNNTGVQKKSNKVEIKTLALKCQTLIQRLSVFSSLSLSLSLSPEHKKVVQMLASVRSLGFYYIGVGVNMQVLK
jgi:hypothetical protein